MNALKLRKGINKDLMRDSNLELARIVAMSMIVIWHFIVHGLWGLDRYMTIDVSGPLHVDQYVQWFISCLCIVGVNVFILISGFYRIRLRWNSIIRFYFLCLFYSLAIFFLTMKSGNYNYIDFLRLFTVSNTPVWFFPAYFILMLVSPILNAALDHLDIKHLRIAVCLLLVLTCITGWYFQNGNNNGYNAYQLLTVYFIGGYLSKEPLLVSIGWKKPLIMYAAICCSNFFSMVVLYYVFHKDVLAMLNYNCIFVVLSSVCLFLVFRGISLRSKTVNMVSSTVVAALFIQSAFSSKIYGHIHNLYMSDGFTFHLFGWMVVFFIAIFAIAFVLEFTRKRAMNPICDAMAGWLDKHMPLHF